MGIGEVTGSSPVGSTMKYALVTGASTGIGRAVAIELGNRGYKVGLVARNKEKLEEAKAMISDAEIFVCDFRDLDQIADLVKKIDHVDLLINVAGLWHNEKEVYAGKNLEDFDKKTILDTYTVGLIAPTLLIRDLLPKMPKNSAIVNLTGTFIYGGKGQLPYFVSKRALEDLTVGLSEELEEKGIRVNCVSPADTTTDALLKYFPDDAINANTPEQVAALVIEAAESTETGNHWTIREGKISKDGFHK